MLNSVTFYQSDNCKYTQDTRMDTHKDLNKHRGFNKVNEERMYTHIKSEMHMLSRWDVYVYQVWDSECVC